MICTTKLSKCLFTIQLHVGIAPINYLKIATRLKQSYSLYYRVVKGVFA